MLSVLCHGVICLRVSYLSLWVYALGDQAFPPGSLFPGRPCFSPWLLVEQPHWWAVQSPAGGIFVDEEQNQVLKGSETRTDHLSTPASCLVFPESHTDLSVLLVLEEAGRQG